MNTAIHHQTAQSCMEAWLNCENLIMQQTQQNSSISRKTQQVVDECAQICMGTFHAMQKGMLHISELALLCVGICEECAEHCERYEGSLFRNCAAACRQCSAALTSFALPAV